MHFVDCGKEPPASFQDIKAKGFGDGDAYAKFISDLEKPFNSLCGYCERPCIPPRGLEKDHDNQIDHFRPRRHFPEFTFTWENLVYVCRRCNDAKGEQFPGKWSKDSNLILAIWDAQKAGKRFVDPSADDGYVNPRDPAEKAETFFVFDRHGHILPDRSLDDQKWSKAWRTIRDLNLNPDPERRGGLVQLRKSIYDAVYKVAPRRDLKGFPSVVIYARRSALSQS